MADFRIGRRIAIDFGSARIGVACSSLDGLISSPLTTVLNNAGKFTELARVFEEQNPIEIYVGLPLNLNGEHTRSTELAIEFARELADHSNIPIRLVDERMSTRQVQAEIRNSGKSSRESRHFIDAAAATLILEGAISLEKSAGRLPGILVSEYS